MVYGFNSKTFSQRLDSQSTLKFAVGLARSVTAERKNDVNFDARRSSAATRLEGGDA